METKSRRVKLPTITEKPRYCSFNGFSTQPMFTRRVDFLIMSSVKIFDLCLLISMPTSLITSIATGLILLAGMVPALNGHLTSSCIFYAYKQDTILLMVRIFRLSEKLHSVFPM